MAALIAGERDRQCSPTSHAAGCGRKTARLTEALTGRFTDHHVFPLPPMLQRIDGITADIAHVHDRIDARLDAIPGVGRVAAQMILAEIGTDMTASRPRRTWPPGPGSPPGSPQPGSLTGAPGILG